MDKSKNFLEDWFQMQNTVLQQWAEQSKGLKSENKAKDQSQDLMAQWMNQQQQFMEQFLGGKREESPAEALQKFIQSQMDYQKWWMEQMQKNTPFGAKQNSFQNMTSLQDTWNSIFGQLQNQFGQAFGAKPNAFGNALSAMDTLSHIFNNTRTYLKMYELWQPVWEAMQGAKPSFTQVKNAFDSQQFSQMLEELFSTLNTQHSKDFLEQMNGFTLSLLESMKDMNQQWGERFEQMRQMLPENFSGQWLESQGFSYDMYYKMQKNLAPIFTMLPPGKEKDMLALMLNVQDKYVKYYIKSSELQSLLVNTASKAMDKSLQKVVKLVSDKKEPVVFDDFFNFWLDITENDMIQLYSGDAFSRLQGELLSIGSSIKKDLDKQMEEMMAHLPIAPRSEIDELTALVHELRGKIRNIERDVKQNRQIGLNNAQAIEEARRHKQVDIPKTKTPVLQAESTQTEEAKPKPKGRTRKSSTEQ
jgi:hypothetical protein